MSPAIRLSAAAVRETAAASEGIDPGQLGWRICREYARRSLETLAQRVDARACWADLVLPAAQVETLRQIAIHVRQRAIVNDRWGFAAKHARGLGLTVAVRRRQRHRARPWPRKSSPPNSISTSTR